MACFKLDGNMNREIQNVLQLDTHTLADLNLFGSAEGRGLFEYCDFCQTDGGRAVLRRRMLSPWANPTKIVATQESVAFISQHREVFAALQLAYLASHVDRYLGAGMPIVRAKNSIEFGLDAFHLWANYDNYYAKIVHGVALSQRFLLSISELLAYPDAQSAPGELTALFSEMQTLMLSAELTRAMQAPPAKRFWQKLRLDQCLRLYEKTKLIRLMAICYELDALVSLADATHKHGLVMPIIETGPTAISASELVHPLLEHPVGNPLALDQAGRVLFLTGPNMAGKTTYLRAILTALYFAHLGMGVPAKAFSFVPVQRLLTSISLSDNLADGISFFRAEALRVKAVAQALAEGSRTIAIMDEPFKGTNVKDALDASFEVIRQLAAKQDSLFVISSHLIELEESLNAVANIDYWYFEAQEHGEALAFDYRARPGVSDQRLGVRVLHEEGVFELLSADRRLITGADRENEPPVQSDAPTALT